MSSASTATAPASSAALHGNGKGAASCAPPSAPRTMSTGTGGFSSGNSMFGSRSPLLGPTAPSTNNTSISFRGAATGNTPFGQSAFGSSRTDFSFRGAAANGGGGPSPPIGPRAMQTPSTGSQGSTFRSANSVQYRPANQGMGQMVANNIQSKYYSKPVGNVVYGQGLGDGWWR